jgi:hypothetical protein
VLVERQVVVAALLVEPIAGVHLRQQVDEHAGSRASRSALAGRAQQELRELAHPVRGEPAADPLARDVLDLRRPLAHLAERVLVRVDIELRDEAKPAHDPQRVVAKARGLVVRRTLRSRSARPSSGSSTSPVSSRRAIALIVKSRRSMSCSSEMPASATISKSCRPGPVERSTRGGANSIRRGWRARAACRAAAGGRRPAARRRRGPRPCRAARARPQLGVPDAGDDEVEILDRDPSSWSRTAPPTR